MNKRLACFIAAVFLLMPVLNVDAQRWILTESSNLENAYNLLTTLGMIQTEGKGITEQDIAVSRGELADSVLRLTGEYETATYSAVFEDVKENTKFSASISKLTQMGIIHGKEGEMYFPEEQATYEQAVKLIIFVLGYDKIAGTDGYPDDYMRIAQSIGLTNSINVSAGTKLTRGLLAALMFNSLECKVAQTDFQDKYYAGEETLMKKNLYMEKVKGILSDNGITALTGESAVGAGNAVVSGIKCADEKGLAREFLGYEVVMYYTAVNDENSAVFVYATNRNANMEEAAQDLLRDDERNSLTKIYYKNEDSGYDYVNINKEADVIYNGMADNTFTVETMLPQSGKVIFIDNNNDGTAEVVNVREIDNYVVSSVNLENQRIYDKYGKMLEIQKSDTSILRSMYGTDMQLSQIKEWDVLSVVMSKNSEFIEITVVNDPVTGVIDAMFDEDGRRYITVDNESFAISKSYEAALESGHENAVSPYIGQSGTYYLDDDECVAAVVNDDEIIWNYGYMVTARFTEDENVLIKLIKDEQGVKMYNVAESVKIDGIKYDEPEAYNILMRDNDGALTEQFCPRLVKFRLNGVGQIAGIDTAIKTTAESNDSLSNDVKKTNEYWSVRTGRFGIGESIGVMVSNNTKVFRVPQNDIYNEDKYAAKFSFQHNYQYLYEAFDVDFSGVAGAIAVYMDEEAELTDYESALIVKNITTKVDSHDDIVTVLEGYGYDGVLYEYEAADTNDFEGIDKGDIITYHLNYSDKMYNIEMQYDLSENDDYTTTKQIFHSTGDYTEAYMSNAQVYLTRNIILDKQGGYIQCLVPGKDITTISPNNLTLSDKQIYSVSDAVIYLIDTDNKNRIEEITADELEDYVYYRNNEARAVLLSTYTQLRGIYVYI